MVIGLIVLSIWVLLNILFVVIVVPPRKPRREPRPLATSPAPLDPSRRELEPDEPFSLRHVVASVAMGAFFVLVPPLLALRDAVVGLFRKTPRNGS
jgi:hypothetical protein